MRFFNGVFIAIIPSLILWAIIIYGIRGLWWKMQSILKRYIRQSIANWLRNEIRKDHEEKNKLDIYYFNVEKINSFVDKLADDTLENLDAELENLKKLF